ncbi:hypothetical protein BDQ17DRAFT_1378728 [Cyathus striatus]|nr:hypothetical protein BDQ17DRAFT_1378728 [Cyathus striatus]
MHGRLNPNIPFPSHLVHGGPVSPRLFIDDLGLTATLRSSSFWCGAGGGEGGRS